MRRSVVLSLPLQLVFPAVIGSSLTKKKSFVTSTGRSELARTEFLSDPDQRLQWQSHSLPTDDLCTENAIMLSR